MNIFLQAVAQNFQHEVVCIFTPKNTCRMWTHWRLVALYRAVINCSLPNTVWRRTWSNSITSAQVKHLFRTTGGCNGKMKCFIKEKVYLLMLKSELHQYEWQNMQWDWGWFSSLRIFSGTCNWMSESEAWAWPLWNCKKLELFWMR